MKISDDLIKRKKVAGWTQDGRPLLLVETHGGLYAMFLKKKQGGFEAIAAAPHLAVCCFMAEKREPHVRWQEDLLHKSEKQAEERAYRILKEAATADKVPGDENSGDYIVWDPVNSLAAVMDVFTLRDAIKKGEVDPTDVVRRVELTDEPHMAVVHPDLR